MDTVPIPSQAIGYVGMVAMLRRVGPEREGRLVAVRLPVGHTSSLSSQGRPTFAWQVLLLGAPIHLGGKPCRQIVLADQCLMPVSKMDPDEVERLALACVQQALDETLQVPAARPLRQPLSGGDLKRQIERAETILEIRRALEVVALPVVLEELGFRPSTADSTSHWHWSGLHQGAELYVTAADDMFGTWTIVGRSTNARQCMWAESKVVTEEPRGRIAHRVLRMWRSAFGDTASLPELLSLGQTYEQHQQDLRRVNLALPTLEVDGEVLRATRRWIAQRHLPDPGSVDSPVDQPLLIRYGDGLLRLEVSGSIYACPARGVWLDDLTLSLQQFLAVPAQTLRGRTVALVQCADHLRFNGQSVPLRNQGHGPQPSVG